MNNSVFRISLDIHRQTTQEHLAVKKGDTARKIIASLSDGGKPYRIDEGCYAVFRGKKPDGNVLYNNCTVENNCIVYEFTEQTAASAGYMTCEFQLYGADDQLITSPRFAIIVSGLVYDDSEVESSAEFTALSRAMTDLVELKATGLKGDTGPQGPMGPQGPQGESDVYYIRIDGNAGNELVFGEDYESIRKECESGRAVAVLLEADYDRVTLPFVRTNAGGELYFSSVCDGKEWQVIITRNPEDGSADVAVKTLSAADSPEMYFQITDDGMISLKPEYRGHCSKTAYPYALSDDENHGNGSKNAKLPENIVIPEIVNEIAVTSLAPAMFGWNDTVKSIAIPSCITKIPEAFCWASKSIKSVSGTENVKVIGGSAFRQAPIEKISLPSLESTEGDSQFLNCVYLTVADVGNKITYLPAKFFSYCERLSYIHNGEGITAVGDQALYITRRLLPPKFLSKLTDIGAQAFRMGRVTYAWETLADCTFGANATSLQINPTDYWSDCTATPCNTPLRSTFHQNDPRWTDLEIGTTGRTYGSGCVITSAAMIYSALMGVDISGPVEYAALVEAANPDLLTVSSANFENQKQYLEAVGLSVELRDLSTKENLQAMYDALAAGALVLSGVDPAHAVVIHGVNDKGELLIVDSQSFAYKLGDYRAFSYPAPIQNTMRYQDDYKEHFLIVTKN